MRTKAELLARIRVLLDVPHNWGGKSQLRTSTLNKAARQLGIEQFSSSGPMARKVLRQKLREREADGTISVGHEVDAKPLRRDELEDLVKALEEVVA